MHQSQRNDQKRLDLLDKRLAAYATAAGALLTGITPSEAAIHYASGGGTLNHNMLPIFFAAMPITMPDGGGSPFGIFLSRYTSGPFAANNAFVSGSTGNSFIGTSSQAVALPAGYLIVAPGPASWTSYGTFGNLAFSVYYGSISITNGGSFLGQTAYLGLRFDVSGNTHYGWCQVSISSNCQIVEILGRAWEDIPGLGIKAGEKDISLSVALSAFTAEQIGNTIKLQWYTQSEVNNMGFIVERAPLNDMKINWLPVASYRTLDVLRGAGNTSERTDYSFTDHSAQPGQSYAYRLISVDTNGYQEIYQTIHVERTVQTPTELTLEQNYPNPFNPATTIQFGLPEDYNVSLKIFNIEGQLIQTLVDGALQKGPHRIDWQAKGLPAGIYFYELKTSETRLVKKMHLVK